MEGTSGTTATSVQNQAAQGQDVLKSQPQNQFSKKTTPSSPTQNSRGTDTNPLKSQSSEVEKEVANSFQNPSEEDDGDSLDENQDSQEESSEKEEEVKDDRKWKLKIKGKDVEVNEAQLVQLANQGGRMYMAMEEAATYRKQTERFSQVFDKITKDPEAYFELGKLLGHDIDSLTHSRVVNKLNYDLMDPGERRVYDLEQENKRYREAHEKEAKRIQDEKNQQLQTRATEHMQNELVDFYNGRKRDGFEMKEVLQIKLQSVAAGKEISIAKAYEIAQSRAQRLLQSKLESLTDEDIENLPPAHKDRLRKHFIQKAKFSQSATAERKPQSATVQRQIEKKPMTVDEFFGEYNAKRFRT